jgi:hypothetical protein
LYLQTIFGIVLPPPLRFSAAVGIAGLLLCAACGFGEQDVRSASVYPGGAGENRLPASAGTVTDSMLSAEEELRRFRADMPAEPTGLDSPHHSRDALVSAFVKAATQMDTLGLQSLHISRREFAYFYFPFSVFASDPYRLPPALVWFQITAGGGKGLNRTVQILSESGTRFDGYDCGQSPTAFGSGSLWQNCNLRWRDAGGALRSARLFGSILELGGHYKFVSYRSEL